MVEGVGGGVPDADVGVQDSVDGGTGADSIMVKDGQMDMVNCGGGTDSVTRDSIDVLRNC